MISIQDFFSLYSTEIYLVLIGILIGSIFTYLIKKSFVKSGSNIKQKQFKQAFELMLLGVLLILIIAFINLLIKL